MHGLPASLVGGDGLRAARGPDEVDAGVVEEVLRGLERRVGDDLERVAAAAPRASPASCRISIARVAQRAARAEGRKIIALRVLAATIALNSAVEVGLVIGSSASTTPIGSATYWMPRSGSSSITPTERLSLQVVEEELGGDVVLDHLVLEHAEAGLLHRQLGELDGASSPATTIAQTIRSTASWSSARSAVAARLRALDERVEALVDRRDGVAVGGLDAHDGLPAGGVPGATAVGASDGGPALSGVGRACREVGHQLLRPRTSTAAGSRRGRTMPATSSKTGSIRAPARVARSVCPPSPPSRGSAGDGP